jgi:hypothetical protein
MVQSGRKKSTVSLLERLYFGAKTGNIIFLRFAAVEQGLIGPHKR